MDNKRRFGESEVMIWGAKLPNIFIFYMYIINMYRKTNKSYTRTKELDQDMGPQKERSVPYDEHKRK